MRGKSRTLIRLLVFVVVTISFLHLVLLSHLQTNIVGIPLGVNSPIHAAIEHGSVGTNDVFTVPVNARSINNDREVRHLMFLKVHKAASGTIISLIFRFGITRNLTFALPKQFNFISYSGTIQDDLIYPKLKNPFDIMACHLIYNRTAIEKYLHSDTSYIGIMREPYQQFKSSMNYFHPMYVMNISRTEPVHEYLKNPKLYEGNLKPRFSLLNNRQSVEYGLTDDVIISKNESKIDKFIQKLDKEFQLVIIVEYMDESLVLMRRLFSWSTEDVIYRRLHVRGYDRETTKPRPYDRERFRQWAAVDYALYDFFVKRLWRQIRMQGPDFFDELLSFRKIKEEVEDFCKFASNTSEIYNIPASKWNTPLYIDSYFCKLFTAEEEEFKQIIAYRQYGINVTL